jgi:hypothetical protein
LVEEFEEAAKPGQQPQLDELLPGDGPERIAVLLDSVRVHWSAEPWPARLPGLEDY